MQDCVPSTSKLNVPTRNCSVTGLYVYLEKGPCCIRCTSSQDVSLQYNPALIRMILCLKVRPSFVHTNSMSAKQLQLKLLNLQTPKNYSYLRSTSLAITFGFGWRSWAERQLAKSVSEWKSVLAFQITHRYLYLHLAAYPLKNEKIINFFRLERI